MNKTFSKDLIKLFRNKTRCGIQYNKCPCNSCFHSIDADFKHICWLILIHLRGDYDDSREILASIKEELDKKEGDIKCLKKMRKIE